jgi:peptidoglycan/xylan/chitin deacetylase (PgdA/CDA1 family)
LLNKTLSFAVRNPASDRFLGFLERFDHQRPNYLRVLTYHLIEDPAGFEEQVDYLARRYPVVSAHEVLAAFEGRSVLSAGAIMITFDDAYRNFGEVAWPVLKRRGLPVTLFVPTAFPDQPDEVFWWDRLEYALEHTLRRDELHTPIGLLPLKTQKGRRAAGRRLKRYLSAQPHRDTLAFTAWFCRELLPEQALPEHALPEQAGAGPQTENPVLGWDDLRQLAGEGVLLGAHTRTHPLMNRVTPDQATSEAAGSLQDLKREIGAVLPVFAYPGGRFSEEVVDGLRQAGFALAFTTIRGTNILPSADPLRLRRINIGRQATLAVLRTRLLHAAAALNRFRPLTSGGRRISRLPKPLSYFK